MDYRSPAGHYGDDHPSTTSERVVYSPAMQGSTGFSDAEVPDDEYGALAPPPVTGSPYASPHLYPSLLDPTEDDKEEANTKRRVCCLFFWAGMFILIALAALGVTVMYFPKLVDDKVTHGIQDLYTPATDSGDWQRFINNDVSGEAPEYDIFWVFNVTNADDVLYRGAMPTVAKVGPFAYHLHEHKVATQLSDSKVSYLPQTFHTSACCAEITFKSRNGSTVVMKPRNPDRVMVRLLNPMLVGLLHQLQWNPLEDDRLHNFTLSCRQQASASSNPAPGGLPLLQCMDRAFREASNGTESLATALNGTFRGLLPLRPVSQWLTVDAQTTVPSDDSWKAFNEYVLGSSEMDAEWSYMVNTTQASTDQAARFLQFVSLSWDTSNLDVARTVTGWAGHRVVHNISTSRKLRKWNVLDYGKLFVGWEGNVTLSPGAYHERWLVHPNMKADSGDADVMFNVWQSDMARGERMILDENPDLTLRGVKAKRYVLDRTNFAANASLYSPMAGLANVSALRNFIPMSLSNPHFYQFFDVLQSVIVKGVEAPNPDRDQTFMDVDLSSGAVINRAQRKQFNVWLPPLDFSGTGVPYHLPRSEARLPPEVQPGSVLFPSVIQERRYQLSPAFANTLESYQGKEHHKKTLYVWGGVGSGLFAILGVVLCVVAVRRRKESTASMDEQIYAGIYDRSA